MPRLDAVISSMDDIKKSGVVSPTSLLQQKANEVRSNRVNWQSYQQGQMITREDYEFISSYDGLRTPELRMSLIQKSKHQCAKTLINLLGSIAKEQTVQYILVMVNDMIEEDHSRVELFKEYTRKYCDRVWGPFFNMLNRNDAYIKHQTAYIITKMMCWGEQYMEERDMQYFFGFLRQQMKATGNEYLQAVGNCLQMLLRIDYYRVAFMSNDMLTPLLTVLSSKIGFQNQYQFVFCLWCITFNVNIATQVVQFNVVPVLADILNESAKEKVMRIILATFRNLLEKPVERELVQDTALSMVQCKVLKHVLLLETRKYDDQDIEDDIQFLIEKLQTSVQDLSSFDEYVTEVRSGRLEWSPVHKSEKFWRENAVRLNERNYELLKMLIRLLESRDPLIISVAAHDIGEYVRHLPRGKSVIEQLGGKQLVMQHLAHEDPNVRYEALLAVQKLMVHNWEYLGRQLEKGPEEGK